MRSASQLALTILFHPDPARVGERARIPDTRVLLDARSPEFSRAGSAEKRGLGERALPSRGARELALPPMRAGESAIFTHEHVVLVLQEATEEKETALPELGIIGASAALMRVKRDILRVAPLDTPVLIRGETGSGKELIALALHAESRRRHGPSVAVNIAELLPSVAPSELFGHARGAFTGAADERPGYFQRADTGTLFLDEIGEASPEIQVQLLRALESKRVHPVGSTQEQRVDVRVVAATDLDLERAVAAGRFRSALYYRLAGYEIHVPPLRERREDIACLLAHFSKEHASEPLLDAELASKLFLYDWPGNVRQLRNVVCQLAMAEDRREQVELVERLCAREHAPEVAPLLRKPSAINGGEVFRAMQKHQWCIERAASELGVSRPSMYRLIAAHPELRIAKRLGREELLTSYREEGGRLDRMSERLRLSVAAIRARLRHERVLASG